MELFKLKSFTRWAKTEKLADQQLLNAIEEMNSGLTGVDLGSGLYKKRIARKGYGKRGGYRTILALKHEERAIFMYGFAKNERDNIEEEQLKWLHKMAKKYLGLSKHQLSKLVFQGYLLEVKQNDH